MRRLLQLGFLVACCSSLGCGAPPVDPIAPAAQPREPAAKAQAEPEGDEPGGDEPASDPPAAATGPSFQALLTAALACPTLEDGSFDTCEAFDAWGSADQPAFAEGRANTELLGMLADKDSKKRILAAEQLRMTLHEENLDAKTADRLIDALAAERVAGAVRPIAAMVSGQNLAKVGKLARAVEAVKAHPDQDMRVEVMLGLGFGAANRDAILVDWAQSAANDKSSQVRNAALRVAANNTTIDPKRACKLVNDFRRDKDSFVRPRAHSLLAESPACKEHFGALIADLEKAKLADYGKVKDGVHFEEADALRRLCWNSDLDVKLKARVIKAAERIATATAVSWNVRARGVEAVAKCDPPAGKALATKLSSDPDKELAARAKELAK